MSAGYNAPTELDSQSPSPSIPAPFLDSLAAVGGINRPAERPTNSLGLSTKLLTYNGKVNNHLVLILVDGGSMGDFISDKLVENLAIETRDVAAFSILFPNGDTSPCNKETVATYLHLQEHEEKVHLNVCPLPHHDINLGKPWLAKWNPLVNWHHNQIEIQE